MLYWQKNPEPFLVKAKLFLGTCGKINVFHKISIIVGLRTIRLVLVDSVSQAQSLVNL